MLPRPARLVVRDPAEWEALHASSVRATIHDLAAAPPPPVDFEREMVLVATAGTIACDGPRLFVGALREEPGGLVATAHGFDTPGGVVGWGQSEPGDAVVVPRDLRPVRWDERWHRYGLPFPLPISRERGPALIHMACAPSHGPDEPFRAVVRSDEELDALNARARRTWHTFRRGSAPLGEGRRGRMLVAVGTGRRTGYGHEVLILDVRAAEDAVVVEVHTYDPALPRHPYPAPPRPFTPTDMVLVPYDPRPVRWEVHHHLR
jgi:hypothetical protein